MPKSARLHCKRLMIMSDDLIRFLPIRFRIRKISSQLFLASESRGSRCLAFLGFAAEMSMLEQCPTPTAKSHLI
jgi:hypothetical protein